MDFVSLINAPIAEPVSEQDIAHARELLGFFAERLSCPAPLPIVIRPAGVRAIVRRAVARWHAARCDLGDAAAALVIRLNQQRPIGIHPIGRFVFRAA